jgi:hypothetical protein
MRYTVVWVRVAFDRLGEIWLTADDPNAVTEAANLIDLRLATNPSEQGQELSEGLRQLLIPPLRILFIVKEVDRIVEVVGCKLIDIDHRSNGQSASH